jgi:hypothetical protein
MKQLGRFDNNSKGVAKPPLAVNQIVLGSVPNATAIAINQSREIVIAADALELWIGAPDQGYTLYDRVPGSADMIDAYGWKIAAATSTTVNVYGFTLQLEKSYTFTAVTGLGVQQYRVLVSELGTVWSVNDGEKLPIARGEGATWGTTLAVGNTKYAVSEPGVDSIYVYNELDVVTNVFRGSTGFGTYISISRNDEYIVASGTETFQSGDTSIISAAICNVNTNSNISINVSVTNPNASYRTEAVYASSTYIELYSAERFFKFTPRGTHVAVLSSPGVLAAAVSDHVLVAANPDLYMWIHEPVSFGEVNIDVAGTWALLEGQHQVRVTTPSAVTVTLPISAVDGDMIYFYRIATANLVVQQELAPGNIESLASGSSSPTVQYMYLSETNKWYLAGIA